MINTTRFWCLFAMVLLGWLPETCCAESVKVIYLSDDLRQEYKQQRMAQEIVRQSFLMVAREDYGLVTQDAVLREHSNSQDRDHLSIDLTFDETYLPRLSVTHPGAEPEQILQVDFESRYTDFWPELLLKAKSLSQNEYPQILDDLKHERLTLAAHDEDAESHLSAKSFEQLNFVSLTVRLRELHQQLKKSPQSSKLYSEIVLSYALLGSVTEPHFGAESKVFKARSMVYADRGLNFHNDDCDLLLARAIAYWLAGVDVLAEKDIARLKELKTDFKNLMHGPEILAAIEWDESSLRSFSEQNDLFSRYLYLLQMESIGTPQQAFLAAEHVIELDSGCLRAIWSLADSSELFNRRFYSEALKRQFLLAFPSVLNGSSETPAAIKRLSNRLTGSDSARTSLNLKNLTDFLNQYDVETDTEQPSFSALGTMALNMQMTETICELVTIVSFLGVEQTDNLELAIERLEHHPAKDLIRLFSSHQKNATAAFDSLASQIPNFQIPPVCYQFMVRGMHHRGIGFETFWKHYFRQKDFVRTDLLNYLKYLHSDDIRVNTLGSLMKISPNCPAVIAIRMVYMWGDVESRATELVSTTQNTAILQGLAERFQRHALFDGSRIPVAEKSLERLMEIAPTYPSFRLAANYYLAECQFEKHDEILKESLTVQDYGLERSAVLQDLAINAALRRDWNAAEEYASEAASSYAYKYLVYYAEILNQNGQSDNAEALLGEAFKRYQNHWLDYYTLGVRNQSNRFPAIREATLKRVSDLEKNGEPVDFFHLYLYQLENQPENFLKVFKVLIKNSPDDLILMTLGAIHLEEQGQHEAARPYWVQMANQTIVGDYGEYSLLAEQFLRPVNSQAPGLSEEQIQFLFDLFPGEQAQRRLAHYAGRMLLLRGERERGIKLLTFSCFDSTRALPGFCTVSRKILRDLGVEAPVRWEEPTDFTSYNANIRIHTYSTYKDIFPIDARRRFVRETVDKLPEWKGRHVWAAMRYVEMDLREDAQTHFELALEQYPDQPWLLCHLGQLKAKFGNFTTNLILFRKALAIAPDYWIAKNNLAWYLAAAYPEDRRDLNEADSLSRSLLLDQENPFKSQAVVLRALVLANLGKFDEANQFLDEHPEVVPLPNEVRMREIIEKVRRKEQYFQVPDGTDPERILTHG